MHSHSDKTMSKPFLDTLHDRTPASLGTKAFSAGPAVVASHCLLLIVLCRPPPAYPPLFGNCTYTGLQVN